MKIFENIIGLGSAGCNLVDTFKAQDVMERQYYKIHTGLPSSERSFALPKVSSPEEYKQKKLNFSSFLKDVSGETLVILGGSGMSSGASLMVLQALKKSSDISVLYVCPEEVELLSGVRKALERTTYYVLQEYARSGEFEQIFLISNPAIEVILGGVSLKKYYESINDVIVSNFLLLEALSEIEMLHGSISEPFPQSRIKTFGLVDVETGEERLFFPMQALEMEQKSTPNIPLEKQYYYAISSNQLENDDQVLTSIREHMRTRLGDDVRVSYGIYEVPYDTSYAYCVSCSAEIQPEENRHS